MHSQPSNNLFIMVLGAFRFRISWSEARFRWKKVGSAEMAEQALRAMTAQLADWPKPQDC